MKNQDKWKSSFSTENSIFGAFEGTFWLRFVALAALLWAIEYSVMTQEAARCATMSGWKRTNRRHLTDHRSTRYCSTSLPYGRNGAFVES